ncbi:hypothetical protein PG984_007108 [Apiospora sp. TS-2023a]
MSAEILKDILKFAAGEVWDLIKSSFYKPDTSIIDAIFGGFARLETLIRELDYDRKLWGPQTKIYYWVKRIQETVDDLKHEDNAAHREAYNNVIIALKSDSGGIRYQTFLILNILMEEPSPIATDGLLKYWESEAYKKLADRENTSYHMHDYIKQLDGNIAIIAALLHLGMELSMYIASSKGDAEAFRQEAETRVSTFRNTLYNKLYPPILRQLKTSYDDPGKHLTDGRWFNLYVQMDTSNKSFLSINPMFVREVALHTPDSGYRVQVRSFRFVASDGAKPLGPVEMHAYWEHKGHTRVKFYKGYPDIHETTAYTNSPYYESDTSDILYKLKPSKSFWDSSAKSLQLVPYKQGSGRTTDDDQRNTWSTSWRLEETSSPR